MDPWGKPILDGRNSQFTVPGRIVAHVLKKQDEAGGPERSKCGRDRSVTCRKQNHVGPL